MKELPHSKSCFVCGSQNQSGLKLRFNTDGQIVESRFSTRDEHSGFFRIVHGGILATVLDEVMVWACAVRQKRFCFSAEMTVRYLSPVPIGMEVIARGEVLLNKRDRLYVTKGELLGADGQRLAEATGKYMPIQIVDFASLAQDFEGTPEQLREFLPGP